MAELPPCPFCKLSLASVAHIRDGKQVICAGCGACGAPAFNGRLDQPSAAERAIAAWSDRGAPPATQPSATVGEVQDVIEQRLYAMIDGFADFMDFVPAERDRMRARARIYAATTAATLHTPPPVATATVVDAGGAMTANKLKAVIRAWLDADDATHWGAFETALDAAVSGTPERAAVVAMLRADAATMRANAHAYSEEAPTDAKALHEVAATLAFKAAQIERGDHLAATPTPPAGDR